jgi:hypothetical protein
MSNNVKSPAATADRFRADEAAAERAEAQLDSVTPPSRRDGGVTPRVVLLCLALAVFFGYVIPIADQRFNNTRLGATHMPVGGIAVLLALVLLLNPALRFFAKIRGKEGGFSRNEALTVYITTLFSCLVPGNGGENYIIPNLIAPFYYATRENKWMEFLQPYLKPWFTPGLTAGGQYNRSVVEGWYTGIAPTESIPWGAWLVPLFAWGAFIFASYIMLGCLAVLLRAQWTEREALRFPLLQLPIEMTRDLDRTPLQQVRETGLFRQSAMWVGLGISLGIGLLNGLHLYFPDVPAVPLSLDTGPLLVEAPWNQIGWTPIMIMPLAIGITYFLSTEVAFSLWFFFLFVRFEYILSYMLGYSPSSMSYAVGNTGAAKPFLQYQQIGAFLCFTGLMLWTAREHLKHVARRAFGLIKAREDEKDEPLPYPVAFWGFILGFAFLTAWSTAAGMRVDVALALWGIYCVIAIGLTRIVVEGGLLFVQPGWTPLGATAQLFNSGPGAWLDPASIAPAAILQNSMMVNIRGFLLPSFLQSFKLAKDNGIKMRPLMALIFSVTLISLVMGLYMNVRMGYRDGGLQMFRWFTTIGPLETAQNTDSLLKGTRDASIWNMGWLALGAVMTYGLTIGRNLLPWFPLHPIGFLVSMTYPMHALWFSIFLGWLCKTIIMRFGGVSTYRSVTPVFLGLILGDVVNMILWVVVDSFTGISNHALLG